MKNEKQTKLADRIAVRRTRVAKEFQLNPPFPRKNMLIELTNSCNHKCIFCANRKMSRPKGMIDPEFVTRILKEAYELGTKEVGFYATGEPFVNKNLEKYIKIAKEIGFEYIYITTNGALCTLDRFRQCVEAGLDSLKFSINGYNRENYQFIHGADDFDVVMKNVKEISAYKKEHNLSCNLFSSSIVTNSTDSKEAFEELLRPYLDELVLIPVRNQGGLMSDIIEELSVNHIVERINHCTNQFQGVFISCEGYLTGCCGDFNNYLAVADLNKCSLEEAWNCETLVELRRKLMEGDTENTMCHNCLHKKSTPFNPLSPLLSSAYDFETLYQDKELSNRT